MLRHQPWIVQLLKEKKNFSDTIQFFSWFFCFASSQLLRGRRANMIRTFWINLNKCFTKLCYLLTVMVHPKACHKINSHCFCITTDSFHKGLIKGCCYKIMKKISASRSQQSCRCSWYDILMWSFYSGWLNVTSKVLESSIHTRKKQLKLVFFFIGSCPWRRYNCF
jgi:hypothetical protein